MRLGDIVRVTDGSYSMYYGGSGRLNHTCGNDLRGRKWEVLATDLVAPTDSNLFCGADVPNDLMLCEVGFPEHLLFIHNERCVAESREESAATPTEIIVSRNVESVIIRFA